jgi:hypothetical protein
MMSSKINPRLRNNISTGTKWSSRGMHGHTLCRRLWSLDDDDNDDDKLYY